ncbi:MAG: methyltransferase domain-containing protein [Gemmatimonadota bacterium]
MQISKTPQPTRRSQSTFRQPRYRVEFPPPSAQELDQDEAYFYLVGQDGREKILFHDYGAIYERKGLYEQLFYDRLRCQSPTKVSQVLAQAVSKAHDHASELRVLDLGAGNGMAGEALAPLGPSRIVGVDIIPEAREAAIRDRPWVYDRYYVADFCNLDDEERDELHSWSFNCLVSVAALGFGDIPPQAMAQALELVEVDGWIAFNIKSTFLDASDESGFSTLVRELIFSEYIDLFHLERYQHRLSIHGQPLNYFALIGKKSSDEFPARVSRLLEQGDQG